MDEAIDMLCDQAKDVAQAGNVPVFRVLDEMTARLAELGEYDTQQLAQNPEYDRVLPVDLDEETVFYDPWNKAGQLIERLF